MMRSFIKSHRSSNSLDDSPNKYSPSHNQFSPKRHSNDSFNENESMLHSFSSNTSWNQGNSSLLDGTPGLRHAPSFESFHRLSTNKMFSGKLFKRSSANGTTVYSNENKNINSSNSNNSSSAKNDTIPSPNITRINGFNNSVDNEGFVHLNSIAENKTVEHDYLPAIKGTITHSWGTKSDIAHSVIVLNEPKANNSNPLPKDHSTSELGSRQELIKTTNESISRPRDNSDLKITKTRNRNTRIHDENDIKNMNADSKLHVGNDTINLKSKPTISKQSPINFSQRNKNSTSRCKSPTKKQEKTQNSSLYLSSSKSTDLQLTASELNDDDFIRSDTEDYTSEGEFDDNDSRFSFEYRSVNGRTASMKYYSKLEPVNNVYIDDMYEDENFDENMNYYEDSYDDEFEFPSNQFHFDVHDDIEGRSRYGNGEDDYFSKDSAAQYGIELSSEDDGSIKLKNLDEGINFINDYESVDQNKSINSNNKSNENYNNNKNGDNNAQNRDSKFEDAVNEEFEKTRAIEGEKKEKLKKLKNYNDLFDLSDDDDDDNCAAGGDYNDDNDDNDADNDDDNEYEDEAKLINEMYSLKNDNGEADYIPLVNELRYFKSNDDDNSNEENPDEKESHQLEYDATVLKINTRENIESEILELETPDLKAQHSSKNKLGSFADIFDLDEEYSLDDQDQYVAFDFDDHSESSDDNNRYTNHENPSLQKTQYSISDKGNNSVGITITSVNNKTTVLQPGIPKLTYDPSSYEIQNSTVSNLLKPSNQSNLLKYHDISSYLESDIPGSTRDLFFIDETEEDEYLEGIKLKEDDYLDEINNVPEDYDFSDPNDNTNSTKSFSRQSTGSFRKTHSFSGKPIGTVKESNPIQNKLEIKNKTITFFNHQWNTPTNTIAKRRSPRKSSPIKNDISQDFDGNSLPVTPKVSESTGYSTVEHQFEKPTPVYTQDFSLSPIQEGSSSVDSSPRL